MSCGFVQWQPWMGPRPPTIAELDKDPAHQAIVDSFHAKWRLERKAAIARRMRKEIHR